MGIDQRDRIDLQNQVWLKFWKYTVYTCRFASIPLPILTMSKRTATELQSTSTSADHEPRKSLRGSGSKPEKVQDEEMGEFEDGWEDEFESDEEIVGGKDAENEGTLPSSSKKIYTDCVVEMEVDDEVLPPIEESEEKPPERQTFIPGVHELAEGEVLEADDSVYLMRHGLSVNWPCLSFDVLRDNLGDQRQRFPVTAYLVSGTQADVAKNNEITVYKMSSLHKTQRNTGEHDRKVSAVTYTNWSPQR